MRSRWGFLYRISSVLSVLLLKPTAAMESCIRCRQRHLNLPEVVDPSYYEISGEKCLHHSPCLGGPRISHVSWIEGGNPVLISGRLGLISLNLLSWNLERLEHAERSCGRYISCSLISFDRMPHLLHDPDDAGYLQFGRLNLHLAFWEPTTRTKNRPFQIVWLLAAEDFFSQSAIFYH